MGSHERAVMGLGPQAVLARVTKHFVTIFSKTLNNENNKLIDFLKRKFFGIVKSLLTLVQLNQDLSVFENTKFRSAGF